MATNVKEFVEKIDTGLKATKDYKRFLYRFKIDGVSTKGVLDYSSKEWDKKTRISQAKEHVVNAKKQNKEIIIGLSENSTLDSLARFYFGTVCDDTEWTTNRKKSYNIYLGDCRTKDEIIEDDKKSIKLHQPKYKIGKKKIKDIRLADIDNLKVGMNKEGFSKQTKNGCSPRTQKKILIQILKPILVYAQDNKLLTDIPTIKAPTQTNNKKIVTEPIETIIKLYKSIHTLYEDNSFYRALFLFALYGRRWNEIRTIEWSDVNFLNNQYTIRAANNKIGSAQTYDLPADIVESLQGIQDNNKGLIFKSPITGKELHSPKKQLAHIKKDSGVTELTMHYFRHILVSAMGERGIATTVLSASLGHTNLETVNNFYLSANHTSSSKVANEAVQNILKG